MGACLRFYKLWDIPFTHDEFSALRRLDYNSLSELFQYGIIPDAHPPLTQVLLYFSQQILGFGAAGLKSIFIIAGIFAILYTYKLGKIWGNKQAGLLSAALVAISQLFIINSQTIRPYSLGLCFILCAVYYRESILRSKSIKSIIPWVLFASLASYTHHFSLLMIGLIVLSSLAQKKFRTKNFYFSLLAILVLYTPNLPIFFKQLSYGGVGSWLKIPDAGFVFEFLSWTLHYSHALGILIALIIIWSYLNDRKTRLSKYSEGLSWFIFSYLIGFFYSTLVSSVMRFDVLIFSTPFLFLFLFARFKVNHLALSICSFGIIGIGLFSLIEKREYYSLFYNSIYEAIPRELSQHTKENSFGFIHKEISSDLLGVEEIDFPFQSINSYSTYQWDSVLKLTKGEEIHLGLMYDCPEKILAQALDYYPFVKSELNYYQGSIYTLSRAKGKNIKAIQAWNNQGLSLDSSDEYGLLFHIIKSDSLLKDGYTILDLSLKIDSPGVQSKSEISLYFEHLDSLYFWRATPIIGSGPREHLSFRIKKSDLKKESSLVSFIWNKESTDLNISGAKIQVLPVNQKLFGLYEDFK